MFGPGRTSNGESVLELEVNIQDVCRRCVEMSSVAK
jgi:hypothetical protein